MCVNPPCVRNFRGEVIKVHVPKFYCLHSPALPVDPGSHHLLCPIRFLQMLLNSASRQTAFAVTLRAVGSSCNPSHPFWKSKIPYASSPCKISESCSSKFPFHSLLSAVIYQQPYINHPLFHPVSQSISHPFSHFRAMFVVEITFARCGHPLRKRPSHRIPYRSNVTLKFLLHHGNVPYIGSHTPPFWL